MKSITYGDLSFLEVCEKIEDFINKDLQSSYTISVGTDSQSFDSITKIVTVITVIRKSKGGIFFYDTKKLKIIKNLRDKIFVETLYSLKLATKVRHFLKDYEIQANLEVHVDIGNAGETRYLISEIREWVSLLGFSCIIKPESYASSVVADKLSKRPSRIR